MHSNSKTVRITVDVRDARIVTPKEMTDEQLATADELIKETMDQMAKECDRDTLMKLFRQRCAVNREAKRRVSQQMQARGIL